MEGLFVGVCENRLDPLKLGRCQVRVFGLHTIDKSELPTELLPWAYPIQPITSAGISGIGHSPNGPVNGTWVIIVFRDKDQQQPLMLGSLGGIPQDIIGISEAPSNELLYSPDGPVVSSVTNEKYTPPEPITEMSALVGPLARLISKHEAGSAGYNAYNRGTSNGKILSNNGIKLKLTEMTVAEIQRRQALPKSDPDQIFAVGMYQIIPGTLTEAISKLPVDRNALFNEKLQDYICQNWLLYKKRPYLRHYFDNPSKDNEELLLSAGLDLCKEFASFEDPRTINHGYPYGGKNGSYYKNGNKASVKWNPTIRQTIIDEWNFRHGK